MAWIKSSFSQLQCVEVSFTGGCVFVRSSDFPAVEILVGYKDWAAFIAGAKAGQFDLPTGDANDA